MAYDYSQKQNLKSGVFLFIATVVTVASIILLGGDKNFLTSYFTIQTYLNQVQGLNIGSTISYSGIKVGHVTKIELQPTENKILVIMNIEEQFSNKIAIDAKASVRTQGALGDKYIYITPGTSTESYLVEGSFLQAENSGDFLDVLSKEAPKLADVAGVVQELKLLIQSINQENKPSKLMTSLLSASNQVDQLMKDARGENSKELAEAITRLNSILGKIDRGEGTLGALINDPSIHERLSSILGKSPRNSYLKPLIRATIQSKDQN